MTHVVFTGVLSKLITFYILTALKEMYLHAMTKELIVSCPKISWDLTGLSFEILFVGRRHTATNYKLIFL